MSKPVKIAYLEISPRQSGKTTRLAEMACDLVDQGRTVIFVVPRRANVNFLVRIHPRLIVLEDGKRLPTDVNPDDAVWFFDEFDYMKSTVVREGAYYATSPARVRVIGESPAPDDVLMQLLEVNGQRHARNYGPDYMREFYQECRLNMAPADFRLSILAEFMV
ncbi:hypothetical protein [Pseudomonas kurunegalensis]|uniref:hypothetical protein n=1 Tax=Pseudomonas kurunegalensis TaxID=485880 RepID=UPI002117E939|nr:hypothetical protein [Pseudomonas kurunegalensis]